MTKRRVSRSAVLAAVLLGLILFPAAPAGALDKDQAACAASKLKAIGKKAMSKTQCEAKAIQASTNVDAECLSKAETRFEGAFGKAEADAGCVSMGDTADVEVAVDEFVERIVTTQLTGSPLPVCSEVMMPCGTCADGVCLLYHSSLACMSIATLNDGQYCTSDVQCIDGEYCVSVPDVGALCGGPCGALPGSGGVLDRAESACASSKIRAAGKKARAKFKCEAKAVQTSTNVDAECLAKAETKYDDAFAKAEWKGGCLFDGDSAMVEDSVDGFVEEMVALQTTIIIIVPLPSCSELGAACGTCGDGICIEHVPGMGCVSSGSLNTIGMICTTDAECPTGTYCMHIFDFGGWPFPIPIPEWACMAPCP